MTFVQRPFARRSRLPPAQLPEYRVGAQLRCAVSAFNQRVGRGSDGLPHRSPTMPSLKLAPESQRQSADQTADPISRQVAPARQPARQKRLMPFVEHTYDYGACDGQRYHAPANKPATQPDGNRQHRKHAAMSELIPRRRHQPDGKRLCAQPEQAEQNTQSQQRCGDSQVLR